MNKIVSKFELIEKNIQSNSKNTLTHDQATIFRSVLATYRTGRIGVLQGGSGTGKSILIKAIKKYCDANHISCAVTASTGKAGSALGGSTIHSYIGLSMTENNNAEKVEDAFTLRGGEKEVERPDILIIDEMSMIGQSLLNQILKLGFDYIFFVGDTNQLPAVKDKSVNWKALSTAYYELTETLRTSDPDLAKVFDDFKLQKEGKLKDLDIFDYENGRNIVSIDYSEIDKLPLGGESCFVGYRNKLVEKFSHLLTHSQNIMYNLNVGITVTALEVSADGIIDENGYYVREFVQKQAYFNGEDVSIIPLSDVTSTLVAKGYTKYDKWNLKLTKKGILITDSTAKKTKFENESKDPKYYINFPQNEVLEYCTLSIINGDTFALVWDGDEDEFQSMLEYYFSELSPFLQKMRAVKDYYTKDKKDVDLSCLDYDVREALQTENKRAFMAWYDYHNDTARRKKAWSNLLNAKKVVSARPTSSRTIHKAQGISVPAIIISDMSFYGASKDAQYVAVSRAKHGIILIRNTPKELVK